MATRTDEPLIVRDGGLAHDDAKKASILRNDIVETRNHMGRTVDAIEERLSPKNIKAQVSSVKNHLLEEIKDAKNTLKGEVNGEISAAKERVREATVGRVQNMVHDARHTVTEAGSSTIDTIKTNPIPAALVAVGLGWLIMSGVKGRGGRNIDNRIQARSRDQWYGYREGGPYEGIDEDGYAYVYRHDMAGSPQHRARGPRRIVQQGKQRVGEVGHDVAEKAKSVAEGAQQAVSDAASTVAAKAEDVVHDAGQMAQDAKRRVGMVARDAGVRGRQVVRRAGYQARRAEQTMQRGMNESPLAFGAVAVAIGAAIGLLLPHTETEDRLIGEKKDRLLEQAKTRAQSAAQQAISQVQDKANSIAQTAGSVAKSAGGLSEKLEGGHPQEHQNGLSGQHQNGLSNGLSKHV